MRAMQVVELGQPLQMNEVAMPTPAAGEVLVRIHTCGLNFGDLLIIKRHLSRKTAASRHHRDGGLWDNHGAGRRGQPL